VVALPSCGKGEGGVGSEKKEMRGGDEAGKMRKQEENEK